MFSYRYTSNELEAWKTVYLARRSKRRPVDIGRVLLQSLFESECMINPQKYADLQSFLDYVPPIHRNFYHTLKYCSSENDSSDTEESDNDSQKHYNFLGLLFV